MMLLYFDIL